MCSHFPPPNQDYDKHRVKRVTLAQAVRAINTSCGIELKPADVSSLKASYGTADGLSFRYQDFCDDVDSSAALGAHIPCIVHLVYLFGCAPQSSRRRAWTRSLMWCQLALETSALRLWARWVLLYLPIYKRFLCMRPHTLAAVGALCIRCWARVDRIRLGFFRAVIAVVISIVRCSYSHRVVIMRGRAFLCVSVCLPVFIAFSLPSGVICK